MEPEPQAIQEAPATNEEARLRLSDSLRHDFDSCAQAGPEASVLSSGAWELEL